MCLTPRCVRALVDLPAWLSVLSDSAVSYCAVGLVLANAMVIINKPFTQFYSPSLASLDAVHATIE